MNCQICNTTKDISFLAANETNIDYDKEYRYRFLIKEMTGTDFPGFPELCKRHLKEADNLMQYS